MRPELVRAAGPEKLRAGLIGCGGRGTQAAVNLLSGDPTVELVAMGDVFEDHLEGSLKQLRDPEFLAENVKQAADFTGKPVADLAKTVGERVKVAPDHRFTGFDAFQKVIASDVDIVMLCTPPGYRPQHFEAAVAAKKHVFAEKPIATDPVGVRRFMAAARRPRNEAHRGHRRAAARRQEYVETMDKIQDGAIGDVVALSRGS